MDTHRNHGKGDLGFWAFRGVRGAQILLLLAGVDSFALVPRVQTLTEGWYMAKSRDISALRNELFFSCFLVEILT
jgi:hypothetical protein